MYFVRKYKVSHLHEQVLLRSLKPYIPINHTNRTKYNTVNKPKVVIFTRAILYKTKNVSKSKKLFK